MADSAHAVQQVSTLGMKWARKFIIIVIILLAFGTWALYDAAIKYPARGQAFAEWAEWQYLIQLDDESRAQEAPGILTIDAPVPDPKAKLASLDNDLAPGNWKPSERARHTWLTALSYVGALKPENTSFAPTDANPQLTPRQRLAELNKKWATISPPPPLHSYDLMLQWFMMVVGYTLGLYFLLLIFRVASKKYRWDPAHRALTFPGGGTITPADLEEVDKRKWDKFIVFLKIKSGVDKIGNQTIRVDTYRHALVEDWILDMEREAFGSQEEPGASTDAPNAEDSTSHAASVAADHDRAEPDDKG